MPHTPRNPSLAVLLRPPSRGSEWQDTGPTHDLLTAVSAGGASAQRSSKVNGVDPAARGARGPKGQTDRARAGHGSRAGVAVTPRALGSSGAPSTYW